HKTANREPGQSSSSVLLQRPQHPGLLRRRPVSSPPLRFRRRGFLAVLGRSPMGRRFPRAFHHNHGCLHVRAARRRPTRHRHSRHLPRRGALFHRRRRRHDAPPLFQRHASHPHVSRRVLLRRRGHSPHVSHCRSLVVHANGRPYARRGRAYRFPTSL